MLLQAIMLLSTLVALATAGVIVLMIFVTAGSYQLNNEVVSRDRFIQLMLPWLIVLGTIASMVGWALWRHRSWTRVALSAATVLSGTLMLVGSLFGRGDAPWLVRFLGLILSGAWVGAWLTYLYRDRDVVAYYAELRARDGKGRL